MALCAILRRFSLAPRQSPQAPARARLRSPQAPLRGTPVWEHAIAVTGHTYSKGILAVGSKLVNLPSDALKVMLLSAYTPAQDSHEFVSDVLGAGTEASGTGYTTGGQALSSVTFTLSGHGYVLSCGNPSWSATGGSLAAAYAIIFDSTPGSNGTNPVLAYFDFGGTATATNSSFGLTINGSGLISYIGA